MLTDRDADDQGNRTGSEHEERLRYSAVISRRDPDDLDHELRLERQDIERISADPAEWLRIRDAQACRPYHDYERWGRFEGSWQWHLEHYKRKASYSILKAGAAAAGTVVGFKAARGAASVESQAALLAIPLWTWQLAHCFDEGRYAPAYEHWALERSEETKRRRSPGTLERTAMTSRDYMDGNGLPHSRRLPETHALRALNIEAVAYFGGLFLGTLHNSLIRGRTEMLERLIYQYL